MKTLTCPTATCAIPHYKPKAYFVCAGCGEILVLQKGSLRPMRKSDRKNITVSLMLELKKYQIEIKKELNP